MRRLKAHTEAFFAEDSIHAFPIDDPAFTLKKNMDACVTIVSPDVV